MSVILGSHGVRKDSVQECCLKVWHLVGLENSRVALSSRSPLSNAFHKGYGFQGWWSSYPLPRSQKSTGNFQWVWPVWRTAAVLHWLGQPPCLPTMLCVRTGEPRLQANVCCRPDGNNVKNFAAEIYIMNLISILNFQIFIERYTNNVLVGNRA